MRISIARRKKGPRAPPFTGDRWPDSSQKGYKGRVEIVLPRPTLALAPMVELSHRALRELIADFAAPDLAFTEMASAGALVAGSPFEDSYFDAEPNPERTVYQLYATKPERLPEALTLLRERPVFGADINFGCAAPHILRAGGGAAWMREPERAYALVRSARKVWDKALSAKLRIGVEEDYDGLRQFCLGLAAAGLDFLTLHPRLEKEKFRRRSRWDYVGRLARDLPIPVLGNGDIRSYADYAARLRETEPAGVMIGREAVRRPWIFALLRGRERNPAFEVSIDLPAVAFRFLDLVVTHLPPAFHETRAKRFFFYFAENCSFAHHLKWKLQNAPDLGSMRSILSEYFEEVPEDRLRIEHD